MQNEKFTITRQELYEKVWSTPLRTLAKGFGLSDVGLAKVCRRNNIPLPGLGHWSKVQAGKKVEKKLLPANENNIISFIEKTNSNTPQSVTPPIRVPNTLQNPHSLIIQTRSLWQSKAVDESIFLANHKCLNIDVSPSSFGRALRIWDALIKYLYENGQSIEIVEKRNWETHVHYKGTIISIRMREVYEKAYQTINETKSSAKNGESALKYRAKLEFELTWNGYKEKPIKDRIRKPLEERLNEVIDWFEELAAKEIEWRERREKAAREYELQMREQKIQKQNLDNLLNQTTRFVESKNIRRYLGALRRACLLKHGRIDDGSEMDLWLKWGFAYANHIDPVLKVVG